VTPERQKCMYPSNALSFEATFGQDYREQRVVQRHSDKQRSREYWDLRTAATVQSPELARLSMQRDLARTLNSTSDLTGMLHQIMATLLQIPEIDCCSIYRVHPCSDGLDLFVQRGLSPQFIPCLAQDAATMAQHRRILRGRPVYTHATALMTGSESPYCTEGLRAVATIPVRTTTDTGGVVLMAASRIHDTLSVTTHLMLETIAAQLGGWLARLEAETALQQAQAELERSSEQRTSALLQANRQLEQSLLHLRTVVTNVPIILFALDRAGMITFAEGKGLDILGMHPDQLPGHAFVDLWQQDRPARDAFRQAVTGNDVTFRETAGARTFEIRLTPMATAEGAMPGVIGLATDVTERTQAEACIERQNQRLTTLRQIDLSIIANRDLSQTLREAEAVNCPTLRKLGRQQAHE
jgi:PAS domain S-box-containing protein